MVNCHWAFYNILTATFLEHWYYQQKGIVAVLKVITRVRSLLTWRNSKQWYRNPTANYCTGSVTNDVEYNYNLRMLRQSAVLGRVEVLWSGWISLIKALQRGWPFDGPAAAIHLLIYIEMQQQEGGGDSSGEMGPCTCAGWMWMKSKGIPKYQREEIHQQGPMPLLTNMSSHTFVLPQPTVGQCNLAQRI